MTIGDRLLEIRDAAEEKMTTLLNAEIAKAYQRARKHADVGLNFGNGAYLLTVNGEIWNPRAYWAQEMPHPATDAIERLNELCDLGMEFNLYDLADP